jgi:hypothetical protein
MSRCHEMQHFQPRCYEKMAFGPYFKGFSRTVNQGVLGSSPRGGANHLVVVYTQVVFFYSLSVKGVRFQARKINKGQKRPRVYTNLKNILN